MIEVKSLNGSLTATETLNGSLSLENRLNATIQGVSALNGNFVTESLSGSMALVSDLNGNLTIPEFVYAEAYNGDYEVTPKAKDVTILPTKNKTLFDDVTVFKIPRWDTTNETGTTVFIGGSNVL